MTRNRRRALGVVVVVVASSLPMTTTAFVAEVRAPGPVVAPPRRRGRLATGLVRERQKRTKTKPLVSMRAAGKDGSDQNRRQRDDEDPSGHATTSPPPTTSFATKKRRRRRLLFEIVTPQTLLTIGRVVLPAVTAAGLGFFYYDNISRYINENWLDEGSIGFLSSDDIQYLPSFLAVLSLLFSILAGNAYSSLYSQQEDIYFALYREVSDAKSLLEQMALVCSGRPFYVDALRMLKAYIRTDLRRLDVPPAVLISRSPSQDPLESIMFLTSVGTPSVVYETVRDLRQSRGERLGAMQRKFPALGIVLLYILALLELVAFPLLGAGTAVGAPPSIFNIQAALFGGLCGATVLVLRIIQELWRTSGGAFNVDAVLATMVKGLSEELDARASVAARTAKPASPFVDSTPAARRLAAYPNSGIDDDDPEYPEPEPEFSQYVASRFFPKTTTSDSTTTMMTSDDEEEDEIERLQRRIRHLEARLSVVGGSSLDTTTGPQTSPVSPAAPPHDSSQHAFPSSSFSSDNNVADGAFFFDRRSHGNMHDEGDAQSRPRRRWWRRPLRTLRRVLSAIW